MCRVPEGGEVIRVCHDGVSMWTSSLTANIHAKANMFNIPLLKVICSFVLTRINLFNVECKLEVRQNANL